MPHQVLNQASLIIQQRLDINFPHIMEFFSVNRRKVINFKFLKQTMTEKKNVLTNYYYLNLFHI